MSDPAAPGKQVRVMLGFRQFQLPPVGDGLLVGRRASIGPKALFESMERLLPGLYELVTIEHPVVEAAIVLRSRTRMLGQERLVALLVENGAALMDETACLQVTVDGEVTVSLAVEV
ncbi:MAG: hypothetical protein H6719_30545 [Sandaracinaceae bacterium]|nr:hypothetical protein [Sandaracinaceae bacterium]